MAFILLPDPEGYETAKAVLAGVAVLELNNGDAKAMEMVPCGQPIYEEKLQKLICLPLLTAADFHPASRKPFNLIQIIYALILLLFFPEIAWAYVDPGSVTILLQVIFAFVVGSLLTFKNRIITGFISLFHRIFPAKKRPPRE